jgi:hypothetical protein
MDICLEAGQGPYRTVEARSKQVNKVHDTDHGTGDDDSSNPQLHPYSYSFLRVYTSSRIYKTKYRSWQSWIQVENHRYLKSGEELLKIVGLYE